MTVMELMLIFLHLQSLSGLFLIPKILLDFFFLQ